VLPASPGFGYGPLGSTAAMIGVAGTITELVTRRDIILASSAWKLRFGNILAAPIVTLLTLSAGAKGIPSAHGQNAVTVANATAETGLLDDEDELVGLTPEERIAVGVYENCHFSVVHIETRGDSTSIVGRVIQSEGSGSGSIWDHEGHILTNYHVIRGASQMVITMHDGDQYDASLVGHDISNDIAVLKIDPGDDSLRPISVGRSERLRVGQRVFALGSPLGLEQTMTAGIVSSLNRTIPSLSKRTMRSIIQIDAALNRGNSGGPLLNSRGELVGMNTAIASRVGENSGIGFAIPSATIIRVVSQLIEFGKVRRPSIGIESIAETSRGLMVVALEPGGPAELAGLKGIRVVRYRMMLGELVRSDYSTADIVTEVDGEKVSSVDDLLSTIENRQAGDSVLLTLKRGEQTLRVPIRLVEETPPAP
jgi:S1-C subfamily serine protease